MRATAKVVVTVEIWGSARGGPIGNKTEAAATKENRRISDAKALVARLRRLWRVWAWGKSARLPAAGGQAKS